MMNPATRFGQTILAKDFITRAQQGIMSYTYKGFPTWKCPFDLAIYTELLWELKPRTIVEFGSNRGGSALWLADQLTALGLLQSRVFSLDINPVTDIQDARVTFGYCDVADPGAHISIKDFRALPKPLLVIDDASHMASHVLNVLQFVDQGLVSGDYLIVEDGILNELGWEEQYEGGPLAALSTFLAERGDSYEIDRRRCDMFGLNATWNPDGYLKRV